MNRKFRNTLAIFVFFAILATLPCRAQKGVKILFDSSKEVSGQKFALRDIAPDLPTDWEGYQFVIVEFRISTPQRFHLGFGTADGYNELRIMSYTAGGWNRLAIPLKFFRNLPEAALDLAATYNQARYTGWINLGGRRGPLRGVDTIGIRMHAPIGDPTFELRSIALSVDDPGDRYLGDIPVVDEFGQWNLGQFEGKIRSLDQLKREWEAEEKEKTSTAAFGYSPYGGYLRAKTKATGFFRTEKIDGRWWFVDPEGYRFLSIGLDCIGAGGGGNLLNLDRRRNLYKEVPPADLIPNANRPRMASFGLWNLFRRYGADFPARSKERIVRRMDAWGFNTIGNWSDPEVARLNRKAFTVQLRGVGIDGSLMGLTDVYTDDFAAKVDAACRATVESYKDNPWLIGYFTGNEPAWLDQEERLCDLILKGPERPIQAALSKWLAGGDSPARRKKFIFQTFRIFLETVDRAVTKYDPNHLNIGIRFGNIRKIDPQVLEICRDVFDVLSFNCYDLFPQQEMMDRAMEISGLPMIIGEYHFGTVDRGMAQSLWQVNSQKERGVAYRYYTEKAFEHPGLIGTAWFQWCDQDLTGRRDGENYNCGFVDVTDRPYPHMVRAAIETAKRLFDIHAGKARPTDQTPTRARGHQAIPDRWNE